MTKLGMLAGLFGTMLSAVAASASGPLDLNTLERNTTAAQRVPGQSLAVHASRNARIARFTDGGMAVGFQLIPAHRVTAKGKVYQLAPGLYKNISSGRNFTIVPVFARRSGK